MAKVGRTINESNRSLSQYLEEIGKYEPLHPDREVVLAQRIKKNNRAALKELVESNLRFVVSVAKDYQGQGLPLTDLINEGNLGLIKAAGRFDETRGFKFISYAVWWIRQSILQALAEHSRIVRLRISRRHQSLNAPFRDGDKNSLIDIIKDENQSSPDEPLMNDSLKDEIRQSLDTLKERERQVIKMYFGIERDYALTLNEIGEEFNLTRERVRQIKEKAIRRLRHRSRSKTLRTYLG